MAWSKMNLSDTNIFRQRKHDIKISLHVVYYLLPKWTMTTIELFIYDT